MGKDIYTNFLLEGDIYQINHFINHHKNSQHTLDDCDIWDCEPYLLEKKCELYINNDDDIISTGGRLIVYKNKNKTKNKTEFRLESKNGYCIDAIKLLCNYYDKLTVKINFYDEDFDLCFGWALIKNTIVLGHDIIYLEDLNKNNSNSNSESNIQNTLMVGSDNKDNIVSFIIDKLSNNILQTNEMNMKINNNIIEFNTYNKPYYIYINDIIEKYPNISFSLIYRDTIDTYYGYSVVDNSKIIIDEFINLEIDKLNGYIDYFKYNTYDDYILQTDPTFLM